MYEVGGDQGGQVRQRAIVALTDVDSGRLGSQAALHVALQGPAGGRPLMGPDRGLCTELVYGVLRRQRSLDRWIAPACERGLVAMAPAVLSALRVGAYQLSDLRVPSYAAVQSTVEACKAPGLCPRGAVGFVHAVLRSLARQHDAGHGPDHDDFPPWIVERLDELASDLGLDRDASRAAWTEAAPLHIHATSPAALAQLQADGMQLQTLPVPGTASAEAEALTHPGFGRQFVAQDAGSSAITEWLDVVAGQRVLDLAAGRGVKSAFMAARGAAVTAVDVATDKLAQAQTLALEMGAPLRAVLTADATLPLPEDLGEFDAVLVDAPCTGLGTLRRRPEIRHRRRAADLVRMAQLQEALANNAARHVRRGGVLLLATCSIAREEGPLWCEKFLSAHQEFSLEPGDQAWLRPLLTGPGWLRTQPLQAGMDGFFGARLVRAG